MRPSIFNLMWLTGAMLCAGASSVAASEPVSAERISTERLTAEQLAGNAIRAGKARDVTSVAALTESLSHDSVLVRQSAAWGLSQLGESASAAILSLTHALGDSDSRVRWGAAAAIGRIGRKGANSESALWQMTRDRDLEVRCAALIALRTVSVSKPSGALSALIDCLRNPATDVQAEAIATFAAIHSRWDDEEKRPVATQLADVLENSTDDVRLAAAVLLGDLGLAASAAISPLADATDDADQHVQAAALRAVGRFADEVDQRWNRLSVDRRHELRPGLEAASKILDGRSRKSVEIARLADQFQQLIASTQLIAKDRGSSPKRPAAQSVKAESEVVNKTPSNATLSSSNRWGWACGVLLMCLGLWGLQRGLSRIVREHAPSKTRMTEIPRTPQESASEATATVNSEVDIASRRVAIDELRDGESSLEAIANPVVRENDSVVLPSLGRKADRGEREVIDTVPQLISALGDEDSRVLAAAALVLSALGTRWQERDSTARTDASAADRAATAGPPRVLGHVESSAASPAENVEEIVRLVSDPVESVRSNLATTLGGIGTDTADVSPTEPQAMAADADRETHEMSITATLSIAAVLSTDVEAQAVPALPTPIVPALKLFSPSDEDELVVAEFIDQPLEAADFIAQLEDADGDVRWRALQALQELGSSAVPELIGALNYRNPAVRKSVIVALGRVGGEAREAMPAMLVALHDVNTDVRCAAVDCLGRLGVVNHSMLHALVQTLSDPNAEVRRYTATTLGRFGLQAREAATALQIASISDIAVKVRAAAQTALQRISESIAKVA